MEQLEFAIDLAHAAGEVLRYYSSREKHVESKGRGDLVTVADRESESLILGEIRKRFPRDSILAEESGGWGALDRSSRRWIVDPLDGTTNYAHGFPMYCVSIGFEADGVVMCGVVYDPIRDETFSGSRSGGAFLNGEPIHVSSVTDLRHGLLSTGFPYGFRDKLEPAMSLFRSFLVESQAVRRAGSAALDLAYVAAGRLDGFWELALQPWDTAAGLIVLESAGGRVTDFLGEAFSVECNEILASNGWIHGAMVEAAGGFAEGSR